MNRKNALGMFATGLLTLLSTIVLLRLWRTDLRVPFYYGGDTLIELALAKSIADGGWIWSIERLSAPFSLEIVAFPQNLTISSAVMKAIAFFTAEPGLILNGFWLLSIAATSVFCYVALRGLAVSTSTSVMVSVLYALLPFTFFRNVAHISLTYVFVPIIAAFSVQVLASSRPPDNGTIETARVPTGILILSSIAIGFDYVYTAFFACFFLAIAGATGAIYGRRLRPVKQVVPVLLLIAFCAAVNFLPSLLSWTQNGLPPNMDYKSVGEAEAYGLKIRHLLVPPSIKATGNFPLENENISAQLGIVGAVGYLLALYHALVGGRRGNSVLSWSAGVLVILGTLLATIGGFGAILNLIIGPHIRAYNRIVVFLAFFGFFIIGLQLDVMRSKLFDLFRSREKRSWSSVSFMVLLVFVLLVGLFDQGTTAAPLIARYNADKAQADEDREMVLRIEQSSQKPRQVYQLPETGFPPDRGVNQMTAYDHGRAYIWSQSVKWSWPSFSRRREAWANSIGLPHQDEFIRNLVISGFDGLWLDRLGYSAPDFRALEAKLSSALGPPITSSHGRYAFYSLAANQQLWLKTTSEAERRQSWEDLFERIDLRFESGFYEEEVSANRQRRHRWSKRLSSAILDNPSARPRRAEFRAQISSNPGALAIKVGEYTTTIHLKTGKEEVMIPIELPPTSKSRIDFSFEGSRVNAPADPRSLYFAIVNPIITEVK